MQRGNFFTNLPDARDKEVIEVLARMKGKDVRVERIVTGVPDSGTWYDQPWPEWVLVLQGDAQIEFAEPMWEERLGAGDWLLIPARRRHRVRNAAAGTIWLAIHADS